jgi:hypothetical protein
MAICALVATTSLSVLGCDPVEPPSSAEPTGDAGKHVRRYLTVHDVLFFVQGDPLRNYDEVMHRWSSGREYEILAAAEALLPYLTKEDQRGQPTGPEWVGETNDLSRTAGRAAWCLERILDVTLPDVRSDCTAEELRTLQEQGTRLVEQYRAKLMALASVRRVQPAEFARLKRKYRGKIIPMARGVSHDFIKEMDDLLGEWPPVGRKYEDLVSIIGARGQSRGKYAPGAVIYRLDMGHHGIDYCFIVKDGIICAVRRESFS